MYLCLLQIRSAVLYIRRSGFVHGALCPSNVLYKHDSRKLAICGLSEAMSITNPGLGTFDVEKLDEETTAYCAPELLTGQLRDRHPNTDFWAVGCIALDLAYVDRWGARARKMPVFVNRVVNHRLSATTNLTATDTRLRSSSLAPEWRRLVHAAKLVDPYMRELLRPTTTEDEFIDRCCHAITMDEPMAV